MNYTLILSGAGTIWLPCCGPSRVQAWNLSFLIQKFSFLIQNLPFLNSQFTDRSRYFWWVRGVRHSFLSDISGLRGDFY